MNRYPYVHVDIPAVELDLVSMQAFELGAAGIETRDSGTMSQGDSDSKSTLVISFENEEAARIACAHLGERFDARVEFVEGDAWREAWKEYFKAGPISERVWLTPSWLLDVPVPEGMMSIQIDPGAAFGSGIHETTRLCSRAIDSLIQDGTSVLDVGCGSAILSILAKKLGAGRCVGVDIDGPSIDVSKENAELNNVEMEASTTAIENVAGKFDMVVANIQTHILLPMRQHLIDRIADDGVLILSGILASAEGDIREAFAELGEAKIEHEGEWISVVYHR